MEKLILEVADLMEQEKWEEAVSKVYEGLSYRSQEYELYYMLAQCKEMLGKWQQAALSYQNALFWSTEEDFDIIQECYQGFLEHCPMPLSNVSIVLVTYNQIELTKLCIESIQYNNLPGTCEIIVVDNLSTDGTREWLKEQKDIKVILNDENKGFPAACNQGAKIAEKENDIFLLNNDTIVMANSIYNLRMALYEEEKVGATGSCSNYVSNNQQIDEEFHSIEEYAEYAMKNNHYSPDLHDKRLKLIGFAMLVKRKVWDIVEGLDERYGLGNCDDDDISLKMIMQGYTLMYCKDSFIYHFGSQSFKKLGKRFIEIMGKNKEIFTEKWKIQFGYFSHTRYDMLSLIENDTNEEMKVLEVGCGFGATLLEINNRYKNAEVYGIDINETVTNIASKYLNVVWGDIQVMSNPFDVKYDYIIMGDVLEHLYDPQNILLKLKQWLNPNGAFIICVPNIMHISVIYKLLHGHFTYQDAGILDKTHLRFFTANELADMIITCGLEIESFMQRSVFISEEERRYIDKLCKMDDQISASELSAYQYIVRARKC